MKFALVFSLSKSNCFLSKFEFNIKQKIFLRLSLEFKFFFAVQAPLNVSDGKENISSESGIVTQLNIRGVIGQNKK